MSIGMVQSAALLGTRATGGFVVHHKAYASTFRQGRHAHEHASFDFILAGGGSGVCGRERIDSVPGTVEFFPAGVNHDFQSAPVGIRTMHIVVPAQTVAGAGVPHTLSGLQLPADVFLRPCLTVLRDLHDADDAAALDLEAAVHEMLAALAESAHPRGVSVHARRAADILNDRAHEPVSLAELAHAVALNPGHLARVFRSTHGVSIGTYQRGLRLRRAAAMLAGGQEPIARVSAACGFADQAHLTNHFRRAFGVTPARYRTLLGVV